MARQSFKFFTPRDKPKKRGPRQHKKNKNKRREASSKAAKVQGSRIRVQASGFSVLSVFSHVNLGYNSAVFTTSAVKCLPSNNTE